MEVESSVAGVPFGGIAHDVPLALMANDANATTDRMIATHDSSYVRS